MSTNIGYYYTFWTQFVQIGRYFVKNDAQIVQKEQDLNDTARLACHPTAVSSCIDRRFVLGDRISAERESVVRVVVVPDLE